MDNKLTISQESVLEAKMSNSILSCFRKNTADRHMEEGDPFFLLLTGETKSGALQAVLDSPVKKHGYSEMNLIKDDEDDLGIGVCDVQVDAEIAWTVQPGKKKAQWDLMNMYKYMIGRVKKVETDSSEHYLVKRQGASGTNSNTGNSI